VGDREERMGIKDDAKCYRGLGEENGLDMKSLGVGCKWLVLRGIDLVPAFLVYGEFMLR
jgi:hypothetical protein